MATPQTRQVLERIDKHLAMAGTDKLKLLTTQVWLSDMRLFADHNAVWNELRANLVRPGLLVEIMVTAAK